MSRFLFDDITIVNPLNNEATEVLRDAYVAVRDAEIVYVGRERKAALATLERPLTGERGSADDQGLGGNRGSNDERRPGGYRGSGGERRPGGYRGSGGERSSGGDAGKTEIISGRQRLLAPALSNAHNHMAMTLLRNRMDDANLHDWLYNQIFPIEAQLTAEQVRLGTLAAALEMIRGGVGVSADMYFFNEAGITALLEAGLKANVGLSVNPRMTDAGTVSFDIDEAQKQMERIAVVGRGRIVPSLMIHSVYLFPEPVYRAFSQLGADLNIGAQMHFNETAREVEECMEKYGCRPVEFAERYGLFERPMVAAHCVHMSESELKILAKHGVHAVHNPSSNCKLASGMADVRSWLAHGINAALGTDGAASNNSLDMFREMRQAAFVTRLATGEATALSAAAIFAMATRNGWCALGFPNSGRISVGAAADLMVLDTDRPETTPLGDLPAALIFSMDRSAVTDLMVDGEFIYRKGEPITIDAEKLGYEVQAAAASLMGS